MKEFSSIVLSSGGLDSTVCAALARCRGRVTALSFDYGQRHRIELDLARESMAAVGVDDHVVIKLDATPFSRSSLTLSGEVPKDRSAADMKGAIPSTYVPGRNTVFISMAMSLAESLDADAVYVGVNALDYSGYPDCRPEYVEAFRALAAVATKRGVDGRPILLETPLLDLAKVDIVRLALELGVDTSKTISCYDPSSAGESCGRCDSCTLRLEAFRSAGVTDGARYSLR